MDVQSLLIILAIGAIAGWLAGIIVEGGGLGLIGNIVVGIIGGFIGNWLLPQIGLKIGSGLGGTILTATLGAVVLLLIVSLVRRR